MKLGANPTLCLLLALLCEAAAQNLQVSAPVVQTELGALRGQTVSVKGSDNKVHAFLGVPFAKPPVGPSLRLAAPQPAEGWKGVRDATHQPPMCLQDRQPILDMVKKMEELLVDLPEASEDCLYLNIYTPANRAPDAKLPVMVWIHGGGFMIGSASFYEGSALAAYQDVVVVLIQYRLGLLGFLSTGDEHMPGNYAMLDQIQALRWIQQHIHNFGGNQDLVTIFGESAGGVSVSLLLLSPLSSGLFHRAIAESGTAAMEMVFTSDPLPFAQAVAKASSCSLESTQKLGHCVRNLGDAAVEALSKDPTLRYPINVDGHFLTKSRSELFKNHQLHTIPFMTGVNNDEAGWLLPLHMAPPNWTEGIDREAAENSFYMYVPDPEDSVKRDLLTKEYIGTGEDRVRNRNGFSQAFADIVFNIPAVKTANAHRDAGADVYLYEYQYPPAFLARLRPSFVKCDHGDDIFTVFGYCFTTAHVTLTSACPKEEEELSRIVMSYWANFARTGSPNGAGLVHWPKYGAEEEYLGIDVKKQVVGRQLSKERFIFLTETLPEMVTAQEEKERVEL